VLAGVAAEQADVGVVGYPGQRLVQLGERISDQRRAYRSGLGMVEQRAASLFQLVHIPAEPGLPDPPHEHAVSVVRAGPRTSVQARGGGVPGDQEVR
jgi:hypothetical protein